MLVCKLLYLARFMLMMILLHTLVVVSLNKLHFPQARYYFGTEFSKLEKS